MTSETPAVLSATYSDFRLIKTRKVISLSFEVPIEQANQVYAVLGMPDPSKERWVAIAPLVPTISAKLEGTTVTITTKQEKPDYGQYAKALKLQGFFRFKEVQAAIGTDAEFRAWVQRQPSCISGIYDQPSPEGECTRNIAAHVRRAGKAGTGYKPEYNCVPLTNTEHQIQSTRGEMEALVCVPGIDTVAKAREWFDKQAVKYAEKWAWETFKAQMGVSSMSEVHPTSVLAWATDKGVANLLPKEFKA